MRESDMNKYTIRYVAALLLFGSNGIVASMITMNSREIVMFRTLIGSVFLIALYLVNGHKFTFLKHRKSFSFFAVFLGIILVNSNAFHESADWIGIFCALMSALMYASMVSCNKKAEEISGMENATLQLTIAFLAVFIYVVYQQGLHFDLQSSDLLPLLILGFVNTGIGCFLYFSSIGKLRVQTIAILGYLEPLSAILFSVIFLQEHMLPLQIAGAVLILSGAMGAEIGGRRR